MTYVRITRGFVAWQAIKKAGGGSVLLVAEIVLLVISTSSFSLSCQILAWIRVRK